MTHAPLPGVAWGAASTGQRQACPHRSIRAVANAPRTVQVLVDGLPLAVEVQLPAERLPGPVETAAYYVVAEALTNSVKHSAGAAARVSGAVRDGRLVVTVADDGPGGARAEEGGGLDGLRDRVEALGGRLRLESPQGGGTLVEAELPCGS